MLKQETGGEFSMADLETMEDEVEQLEAFVEMFTPFQKECEIKVNYGSTELTTTSEEIDKLIVSYGEDPKMMLPKDFFLIFYEFSKEFTSAYTI